MGVFDWFLRNEEDEVDIRLFSKLDGDNRLRQIMEWGDKLDESKLKVFKYAILKDSDPGVKMAALKRIHLFQDKENVRQFLKDEKTRNVGLTCEPYYTMALSRTGVISIEEFEKRVNK
jgi:hypothetical protein